MGTDNDSTRTSHIGNEVFCWLRAGGSTTAQLRPSRITKDNQQMASLSKTLDEFCNPFAEDAADSLMNIATGRVVSHVTESYVLSTLPRGQQARAKFQEEWDEDPKRFLKPVKQIKIQNFAVENVKKETSPNASRTAQINAVGERHLWTCAVFSLT